jgi:hypothetical protein
MGRQVARTLTKATASLFPARFFFPTCVVDTFSALPNSARDAPCEFAFFALR